MIYHVPKSALLLQKKNIKEKVNLFLSKEEHRQNANTNKKNNVFFPIFKTLSKNFTNPRLHRPQILFGTRPPLAFYWSIPNEVWL